MSRAYRPADFEAFLRKHSNSSLSRKTEQLDRAQLDRASRAGSPQRSPVSRPESFQQRQFRPFPHHLPRPQSGYSSRESEVQTLIELGKFRLVPADDLAQLGYSGDRSRTENDVQHLRHQGLIEQRSIEGHDSYSKQVLALSTKRGTSFFRVTILFPVDRRSITVSSSPGKPATTLISTASITKSPERLRMWAARFAAWSLTTS